MLVRRTLAFKPYNGNFIKINGTNYTIPNAGIAGLANTGVFVNGVAGQNLAATTDYWVFAFINGGVVTADFRTAATHAPSTTAGNEGVEILTGDDSRTLIGLCSHLRRFGDLRGQRDVSALSFRGSTAAGGTCSTPSRRRARPRAPGRSNCIPKSAASS